MIFVLASASPVFAVNLYGGWQTVNNFPGVRGYMRQNQTQPLTSGLVASWITVCGPNCGSSWVQTGRIQGIFAGGGSNDTVMIFREALTLCGDYRAKALGAPPNPTYFYSLKYVSGPELINCGGGEWIEGYTF